MKLTTDRTIYNTDTRNERASSAKRWGGREEKFNNTRRRCCRRSKFYACPSGRAVPLEDFDASKDGRGPWPGLPGPTFSFAPDDDGTGAAASLGGPCKCGCGCVCAGGGGDDECGRSPNATSSTGFIASCSDCSTADTRLRCPCRALDPVVPRPDRFSARMSFRRASSSSARRMASISPWTTTPSSQLWWMSSLAFARRSGWRRSMGVRKEAMASASGLRKRYLSCKTASRLQYRNLVMCRNSPKRNIRREDWKTRRIGLPLRLKNSELCLPETSTLLGISPMSSMICAMWSSSLLYRVPDAGSKR